MAPQKKFTKEYIIQKAIEITRRDGISAVTARAVANELNTSSRPIFTFYNSMDELKQDIVIEANNIFLKYIVKSEDSVEGFSNVGKGYINFAKNEKELFKLLFMNSENLSNTFENIFNLEITKNDFFTDLAQDSSGLDREKSIDLYKYMWMMSHAIATLSITNIYETSDDEIDKIFGRMYRGLVHVLKNEK